MLNEIHVVPYKINQEIKPYAFAVPVESQKTVNQERKNKANSMNLHRSKRSDLNEE